MGKFKEENGITRLRSIIEKAKDSKIPGVVLDLLSIPVPGISKIKDAINALTGNEEIEPFLKNELLEALNLMEQEMILLNDRYQVEMNSDSQLTKSFRPIVGYLFTALYVWMLLSSSFYTKVDFEAIRSGDGSFWQFSEIDKATVEGLLEMILGFFFGGRVLEKVTREAKGLFKKSN